MKAPKGPQEVLIKIDILSLVRAIVVVLLIAAVLFLSDLVLVLLASIVLAAAIEPIIKWFQIYKINRLISVIFIYLALALLLIAAVYFLFVPILNETSSLLSKLPNYSESTQLWAPLGEGTLLGSQQFIQNFSETFSIEDVVGQVQTLADQISSNIFSAVSVIFGGIFSFILIFLISFYLAVQEDGVRDFLRVVIPLKSRDYVLDLWQRSQRKIGLWFQGQLLLVLIIGVLTYLGLTLIGLEHALLLAVLSGIMELIPLFGPIIVAVPAVALAFITGGVPLALIVLAFFIVLQQFENQLIYPLVVKQVVGVPAIVVIIAIVAGVQLAGFLGALLSVPIAAVLMELFVDVQKKRFGKVPDAVVEKKA